MATRGRPNPRGTRLHVSEKFRVGWEGWESPLQPRGGSGASESVSSSGSPPPSRPFLPRPGPALGVAASPARRRRARVAAAVAPLSGRRARPLPPAGPVGVQVAPPGARGPALSRGPPPGSVGQSWAPGGREGQPPAPRARRGAGNVRRLSARSAPRSPPPPSCCCGV
ncbi:unnamed protein product [Rangifer tarandus platyrhynchus]|uniref:Uncharacterized protein n=1 Tax=Rangifer tarandus platyrhynchus TaxID=3082113 RepID=A0ABN9A0P4_RANTA|nr:unnamed protein product [Rangifer tarandus platyrhynchus]